LKTYDGLDGSQFVFLSVCKLVNGQFSKFLFVFKTLRNLAIVVCGPHEMSRAFTVKLSCARLNWTKVQRHYPDYASLRLLPTARA
jgi:hypothetical protein